MAEGYNKQIIEAVGRLAELARASTVINNELYLKYDVKRGLRDVNGKGVVCGLTEISEIISSKKDETGESVPCEGELYYRGISIHELVKGAVAAGRFGFEETAFLLLFGKLPSKDELNEFISILADMRALPEYFVRDLIMQAPSPDLMNALSRGVLSLYSYDAKADDISIPNILRQVLELIARFPLLSVYGYNTMMHYHGDRSLVVHHPSRALSTAEQILHLLRPDSSFSELEASIVDIALILHAEHGGGNNSTFTTHVVSSSGTDTYSVIAAALGSLKGPRHGGANIKVVKMFEDMMKSLKSHSDVAVTDHLAKLLDKQAFDKAGLIYGMGHAVYSLSDPRADILKSYVRRLAEEKNLMEEYTLYEKVERLAPEVIGEKRKIYKGVSANVDFYSGFVYSLLGLPLELFTPIFAIARMTGWGAHRIEEISNNGKIIRPGYTAVAPRQSYVSINDR
ncbi:MAG: citrate/2-methylcitrate synthase [Firmicutes bacterium]|nr:citrate/2-methylcitrate synthase [Bacillota bacterium]